MLNIKELFINLIGLKYYTSELDQFLNDNRYTHSVLSVSQQQEEAKYARIFDLRDNPNFVPPQSTFWSKF
jgi:hypothetical protein